MSHHSSNCILPKLPEVGTIGVSSFAGCSSDAGTDRINLDIHAEGDRSPWDFLSASTVQPGNNRALVRPARNAASFDPAARNDGSRGFSHKRSMLAQRARAHEHRIKRESYVRHHDDAVEVWDAGCEIGKLFAEAGHV